VDWAVSRERYWGTPLPIWICQDCGHEHAVGSIAELRQMAKELPDHFELHRPYIDQAVLACPKCGGDARRVPEVMDCWFDSGSMPFAQWHYPFENHDLFNESFPADFITEAVDQTRGWFYTLLAISTLLFDRAPFRNCMVLGLVLDEQGLKMSKSRGNVADVWRIFNSQGADAVRWYLYTVNAPWTPTRFYEEGVTEAMRRFMGTLWNVYAFYVLYANIDGFVPREHSVPPAQRAVIDRWLLSRLAGLVQEVTSLMDSFDITAAGRRIEQFVDDLSNWYVRRCRRRYWASEMTSDKEAAYLTLHEAIVTLAKLIAPFTPFLADEIYGNLEPGRGSVHLADYPVPDKEANDPLLDSQMELARQVVYLGRAARNAVNIKNRQPLSKIVVQATPEEQDELMALSDLVEDELNVRGIEFARDFGEFVSHRIKPRYDLLGPKHGKLMRGVASALASADATRVARDVAAGRPVVLTLEGAGDVSILPEEMTVETVAREGFHVETDNGRSVALDTVITDDLKMEGFARELVNKIQATRKEAGFEISDRIYTVCAGGPESMRALAEYGEYLMGETLSVSLVQGEPDGEYIKEWDVNGEKVTVGVRRVR
jgi:isoleucyl-tRNA synthetase